MIQRTTATAITTAKSQLETALTKVDAVIKDTEAELQDCFGYVPPVNICFDPWHSRLGEDCYVGFDRGHIRIYLDDRDSIQLLDCPPHVRVAIAELLPTLMCDDFPTAVEALIERAEDF
ncbi:MAG: hypothetical protein R3C28_13020 [Pirellulaceae bacterium]